MSDKPNQTAIDWLVNEVNKDCHISTYFPLDLIKRAKEMEKQEISTAYECGWIYGDLKKAPNRGEDYYNIVFPS
jgi:hypothetical protein